MATKYPLFRRPDQYARKRRGRLLTGWLKAAAERRALDRALSGLAPLRSVCDVPCGPGRLFPYWQRRDLRVVGLDLSQPMVEAAADDHRARGLRGAVLQGDAFRLDRALDECADLVASVRFCYYFDRARRVELLRSLAAASGRYVLVQYKTRDTVKGRRNLARRRARKPHRTQRFCSREEIRAEVQEAGLACRRIVPISQFSDRVFVLAERTDVGGELPVEHTASAEPHAAAPYPLMRGALRRLAVGAVSALLALLPLAMVWQRPVSSGEPREALAGIGAVDLSALFLLAVLVSAALDALVRQRRPTRRRAVPAEGQRPRHRPRSLGARVLRSIYHHRNLLVGPPLVYAAFSAYRETEAEGILWPLAVLLVLAGVALRVWAQAHIRFRLGERRRLTTTGPYAVVRNPLYIANTLVCAGATVASELLWLVPVTLAWCVLVYSLVVRQEEARLAKQYGETYRRYVQRVPRWVPRTLGGRDLNLVRAPLRTALAVELPGLLILLPYVVKELFLP